MDAKEKVDSELSWGFCGSYLFGSDYKDDSTILNEFGWNYIPADFDRINPDFSRSGEGTVAVVEESSTSASVLASIPPEKSTASGSSTAANPPPERVSYYRCSESKCRVKKRVERSWEDSSVVITTYEGQHCHHHSLALNQLRTPPPQTQGLLGDIVGNG